MYQLIRGIDREQNAKAPSFRIMEYIIVDPKVMVGKPIIRGTRITVELILERLAGGESVEDILKEYPHLTREGVLAAIAYAKDVFTMEYVYPIKAA